MGRLQRIEQRLERAINGAFAKAFRAEVQPVEIASAVRRAMDERAQSMTKGRTFVPADYRIELSPTDYDRLTAYADDVCDELLAAAEEHADSQRYLTRGPFTMSFSKGGDLETGVFRIHPEDGESGHRVAQHGPAAQRGSGTEASGDRGHVGRAPDGRAPDGREREPDAREPDARNGSAHESTSRSRPGSGAALVGASVYDVERDGTYEPEPAGGWHDATFARHEDHGRGPAGAGRPPTGEQSAAAAYANDVVATDEPAPRTLNSTTRREGRPPARPGRVSDRPWLEIDGDRYPLLGPLTVLGRDLVASIVVEDANVSRRHCEVRVTSDGPHLVANVRDLGSTNGTWVNGQRVQSVRLHDRDQVTIGRTSMTFHAGR